MRRHKTSLTISSSSTANHRDNETQEARTVKRWARYLISGEWGEWHYIGKHPTYGKAYWCAREGTRFLYSEIEIVTDEPETYAGRESANND